MLNKITGWESRTVPPLYVPMGKIVVKAGHWGNLGRQIFSAGKQSPARHESEDLRSGFSHFREITEMCLSQKNGCGILYGCRSLFDFLEEFL